MEIKYADSLGWDFGVTSGSQIVLPGDLQMKTASESLSYACGLKPNPNETVIVVIAMGATESYGPNRNGDGFDRGMLHRCHPTFSRFGHVFVNHKNKDPRRSIGKIYDSFYNDVMDRVELVIGLDNTKATKFVRRIEKGKSIPVSMGIHIPHDICNICGHHAPTIDQWCHHMTRPSQGGQMGPNTIYYSSMDPRTGIPSKDGCIIFVHNPTGKFFDISLVTRPADMTAYMIYGPNSFSQQKAAAYIEEMYRLGYSRDYIAFQSKLADVSLREDTLGPEEGEVNTEIQSGPRPSSIDEVQMGYDPSKVADMIKHIDGMAMGLEAFEKDARYINDMKAKKLASRGLSTLQDALRRGHGEVSFPEMFKLAHIAIHGRSPHPHQIKSASLYQTEFATFALRNPAVGVFIKTAFGLGKEADHRHIRHLRADFPEFSTELLGDSGNTTSKKEAALCGLVAASMFVEQKPSAETVCRGRAIAWDRQKRPFEVKRASLSLQDDPAALFRDTAKQFGEIIF